MLNVENASRIIENIIPYTGKCSVDIVDLSGIVVGSTAKERIGSYSAEAFKTIEAVSASVRKENNLLYRCQPVIISRTAVGAISVWGDNGAVETHSDLLLHLIAMLVKQIAQESFESTAEALKNSYIAEWLFSNSQNLLSDETFLLRGRLLGINVEIPRNIVVLRYKPENDKTGKSGLFQRVKTAVKYSIFFEPENLVWFADNTIILFLVCNDRETEEIVHSIFGRLHEQGVESIACGVGTSYSDPMLAITSYQNAESACKIAELSEGDAIVFYNAVSSIEKLLDSIPINAQEGFVRKVFEECLDQDIQEWTEILSVYYKHNGSIYRAAEELYMHKNTLQYKINKIKERTTYDPRNIQDSLVLYIATILFKKQELRKHRD